MANDCSEYQKQLAEKAQSLGLDFKKTMTEISESLSKEAGDLEDDQPEEPSTAGGAVGIDVKVDWKDVSIKLDLPEFTMKTQEWSFDVPQVTMKNQEMIFHTPSTRMVNKKVGQYPEWHGLHVEWKDIIIGVPEFFMQEQRIVMGIPEFKIDRTSMKLDVPEVTMKTQEIILGLPQFTVVNVRAEYSQYQDRADALKSKAESQVQAARSKFAETTKSELGSAANTLFSCLRTQIQNKRSEATAMLEPAITMLSTSISKFKSIDSDESRAKISELQKQYELAMQKRKEMDDRFDQSITELTNQQTQLVDGLLRKLAG